MNKTARDYQKEIYEWARYNFCYQDQVGLGVAEELGELCHNELKFRQRIRSHADVLKSYKEKDVKNREQKYLAEKLDCLADAIIFHLHWCEVREIFVSFEEAESNLRLYESYSWRELMSEAWKCVSNIFSINEYHDRDSTRSTGQHMLNILAALCQIEGWHYVEDVLKPTWKKVGKRDWIKFPKNGTTE